MVIILGCIVVFAFTLRITSACSVPLFEFLRELESSQLMARGDVKRVRREEPGRFERDQSL
jgi:hypothetical protein